jgi:hypothetical protein
VLTRLETAGLMRGDAYLDLTDKGEALYRDLREYVTGPAGQRPGPGPLPGRMLVPVGIPLHLVIF